MSGSPAGVPISVEATMKRQKPRAEFGHTARVFARAAFGLRLPRLRKGRPGAAPASSTTSLRRSRRSRAASRSPSWTMRSAVSRRSSSRTSRPYGAKHRPEWSAVRWINVDGLTDMTILRAIAEKYQLHPLALEDLLHIPQRPKVDTYGEGPSGADVRHPARLFVVARMIQLVDGQLDPEQVSFFIGHRTLLTFQEKPGDVFDAIRRRLNAPRSQFLTNDASFLLYALARCDRRPLFSGPRTLRQSSRGTGRRAPDAADRSARSSRFIGSARAAPVRREMWPMREILHALQRDVSRVPGRRDPHVPAGCLRPRDSDHRVVRDVPRTGARPHARPTCRRCRSE